MFLNKHERSYNLSLKDTALSLATGVSGAPYAKRHWNLSKSSNKWGHRSIALLQFMPVFGGLAAIGERLSFILKQKVTKEPRVLSQPKLTKLNPPPLPSRDNRPALSEQTVIDDSINLQEMLRKSTIAIKKHVAKANDPEGYASSDKALPSLEALLNNAPKVAITLTRFEANFKGLRKEMEDAHFHMENDKWMLQGVFDGHRGDKVAKFANAQFPLLFPKILKESNGDVALAFELTIKKIHEGVEKNKNLVGGATAVVCYLDKLTHKIYTVTLGDSEANIYRKIDGELKSIPLSLVKDWSDKSEIKRAGAGNICLPPEGKPRLMHSTKKNASINVSRALGDKIYPAISQKPFITINQVQPGDTLVLACDGLKDFVSENETISILRGDKINPPKHKMPFLTGEDPEKDLSDEPNPAKKLAIFALENKKSDDNITIQVTQILIKI